MFFFSLFLFIKATSISWRDHLQRSMVPCLGLSTLASADGKLGFCPAVHPAQPCRPSPQLRRLAENTLLARRVAASSVQTAPTTGFSASPTVLPAHSQGQGRLSSHAKPPLIKRNLAAGTRILLAAIKPLSTEVRGRACIITHRIARLAQ